MGKGFLLLNLRGVYSDIYSLYSDSIYSNSIYSDIYSLYSLEC